MYPLNFPGVDVSVTDESMYGTAGEGTIPLILIGTHEYKTHPNGSEIALGTLPENANKLYKITSQRELIQTFGNPVFYSKNGTSTHGYELNEYGLHAAYQYLGVANQAWIIRGAIDYGQLFPRPNVPRGEAVGGTYWFDIASTKIGVFESNGNTVPGLAWDARDVYAINSEADLGSYLLGNEPVSAAEAGLAYADTVQLIIKNIPVVVHAEDEISTIASLINAAKIPGITASEFELSGKTRLVIQSTDADDTLKVDASISTGTDAVAQGRAFLATIGLLNATLVNFAPKAVIGLDGDFAMVTASTSNELFQKLKPEGVEVPASSLSTWMWFKVGSAAWKAAIATRAIGSRTPALESVADKVISIAVKDDVTAFVDIDLGSVNTLAGVVDAINNAMAANTDAAKAETANSIIARANGTALELINRKGGDIVVMSVDGLLANLFGLASVTKTAFAGRNLTFAPHSRVPVGTTPGSVWVKTTEYNGGANWSIKVYNSTTGTWLPLVAPLLADDAAANAVFGAGKAAGSVYVKFNSSNSDVVADHEIKIWTGFSWEALSYVASTIEPTTEAEEGALWFNSNFRVDIMVGDGDEWIGYKNYPGNINTDPNGVILAGSAPVRQSTGAPLAQNDLWINTSDLENYPKMYRYQAATRTWELINIRDNTTPFGVVFADARATANGRNDGPDDTASMLVSNYVDPDAPDPRTYPDGILLFNMRYSTNNVKEWRPDYFLGEFGFENNRPGVDYTNKSYQIGRTTFEPVADSGRWVTVSGLQLDGAPNMGRKAQRAVIVKSLQATIAGNEDIRAETIYFNLLAAPGYVELIDEMVSLNTDKKEVAFVVGDTPARLDPSGTSITTWANPELSNVASNSELGLVTRNPYLGVYYPWGLSTNVNGDEVMIPASTIALRTIAYNDTVAYPWMAPAGYTRGLVTNATTVGYLTKENEFKPVLLSEGQRGVLYSNRINPIAYIPNRGLVVMGQKTRHIYDSALDRINVARLINYMRYNLDIMAKPFLFEPNDQHTRDSVRVVFERFLGNLVGLRGLYDFIVVCDESNNTSDRIDRNELWIDIAIQPEKAIEFIYIPIRIVNTGTDMQALYRPRSNY